VLTTSPPATSVNEIDEDEDGIVHKNKIIEMMSRL